MTEFRATCPCGATIVRKSNRKRKSEIKYCSRACSGRFNDRRHPLTGPPIGAVIGTCPCGADIVRRTNLARDARRKYCSQACSGRFGGKKMPKATHFAKCGHPKDAENTYANGSCRTCTLIKAAGRPDYTPGARGNPNKPVRTAVPVNIPAPVKGNPEPAPPPWRPPGWAPVPRTRVPGRTG